MENPPTYMPAIQSERTMLPCVNTNLASTNAAAKTHTWLIVSMDSFEHRSVVSNECHYVPIIIIPLMHSPTTRNDVVASALAFFPLFLA